MPVKEGISKPTVECECNRCDHVWESEKVDRLPVQCPKCKSTYWNKPRREKKEKVEVKAKVEPKRIEVKGNGKADNGQPALKEISKSEFLKLAKKKK